MDAADDMFPTVEYPTKQCRTCGQSFPATKQYFYQNLENKDKMQRNCKACGKLANAEAYKKRKANDPCFSRRKREQSHQRYHEDIQRGREIRKKAYQKGWQDPEKRAKKYMKARAGGAGLSIAQYEELFAQQGNVCAICQSGDAGGIRGWNIDHCHTTRKVRFILCCHCNRGLGAFKDNVDVMRKAAMLLDAFYAGKYPRITDVNNEQITHDTPSERNMRRRGGRAGLSVAQFEKMFAEQGHSCAICQSEHPGVYLGWHLDHCHKTRKVRFILCCHCNWGIGAFKDNPETMRKAAALLEDFYDNKPE